MRNPPRGACLLVAALLLSFAYVAKPAQAADASVMGQWFTLPQQTPVNPVHIALLHNGNVLIVAGSEADPNSQRRRAALWNRATNTIAGRDIPWDLFCSAMSFLPDGRVLITGGTGQYDPFLGESYAIIYDPKKDEYAEGPEMHDPRWYPTNTVMADGRTVVISGVTKTSGTSVSKTFEIFDPKTLTWSPPYPVPFAPPLYPRAHLVSAGPDAGNIFYAGPIVNSHILDTASIPMKWKLNVAKTLYTKIRLYGSSVLLPLLPQKNYASEILTMGGAFPVTDPATNTVEGISLTATPYKWVQKPPLAYARIDETATLLPDGTVLVTGGSTLHNKAATAALPAERYDPATNTWNTMAPEVYPRLYHSGALLLPDATVAVVGSNPGAGHYEHHIEIFRPPYLFTRDGTGKVVPAVRPKITAVTPAGVGYNGSFSVTTSPSPISKVMLMRPGAATHAENMEQRAILLNYTATSSNTIQVTAPPNPNVAPPGFYLLFVVNSTGVPSPARFVHLG